MTEDVYMVVKKTGKQASIRDQFYSQKSASDTLLLLARPYLLEIPWPPEECYKLGTDHSREQDLGTVQNQTAILRNE